MTEPIQLYTITDIADMMGVKKDHVRFRMNNMNIPEIEPYAVMDSHNSRVGTYKIRLYTLEQVQVLCEEITDHIERDIKRKQEVLDKARELREQQLADRKAAFFEMQERKKAEKEAAKPKPQKKELPYTPPKPLTDEELIRLEDEERAERALQFLLSKE